MSACKKTQDEYASMSERDLIFCEVLKIGGCARCALRFAGIFDQSLYAVSDDNLAKVFSNVLSNTCKVPTTVCVCCLSLLKQASSEQFQKLITSRVLESDYETCEYSLSLSFPASLEVRKLAVWYHLKRTLKNSRFLAAGAPSSSICRLKDIMKWLLEPVFDKSLSSSLDAEGPLEIRLVFSHPDVQSDTRFVVGPAPQGRKRRRKGPTHGSIASVSTALKSMSEDDFIAKGSVPPKETSSLCSVTVSTTRKSVFISGFYTKYSRNVSQSKWIIQGKRKGVSSVEELIISPIFSRFKASRSKFHASGREDIDVRMLGNGREFIFELLDPHRVTFSPDSMVEMERAVNGSTELVQVRDLTIVPKTHFAKIVKGERSKRKSYRCIVRVSRSLEKPDLKRLEDIAPVLLKQKTPVRVAHRRADIVRERWIYSCSCTYLNNRFFILDLETQAGTYVKEFVHGDEGRTVPNIGIFFECEAEILQLDVLKLHYMEEEVQDSA